MPQPVFGPTDFANPDAPEGERLLRPDHFRARDLSYDAGRGRQALDLYQQSIQITVMQPWDDCDPEVDEPGETLELYIKERPRGPGYVCDFLYRAPGLPVTVYGTLINQGRGLMVNELELWRGGPFTRWEYRDKWDDYIGPPTGDADHDGALDLSRDASSSYAGITTSLLRRIPLGEIVARAQQSLAEANWQHEGVRMVPGFGFVEAAELEEDTRRALETSAQLAEPGPRGRPPLDDDLLRRLAHAYLATAADGPGLVRRLARQFDRPEPTIKDWIASARERGFLSAAVPGRRGAAPGPRLTLDDKVTDDIAEAQSHPGTPAAQ